MTWGFAPDPRLVRGFCRLSGWVSDLLVVDCSGTKDRQRTPLVLELTTQLFEVEREGQVAGCSSGTLVGGRGIGSKSESRTDSLLSAREAIALHTCVRSGHRHESGVNAVLRSVTAPGVSDSGASHLTGRVLGWVPAR